MEEGRGAVRVDVVDVFFCRLLHEDEQRLLIKQMEDMKRG